MPCHALHIHCHLTYINMLSIVFYQFIVVVFLQNSLLLKHNGITVSLQKAYALLLSGTVTILQYKVYASLSRLGYKVYTHKELGLDSINKETGQRADVSNKSTVSIDDDKSNSELNDNGKDVDSINKLKHENTANSNKDDTTVTDTVSGDTNELIKEDLISNTIIVINVEESQNNNFDENLNFGAMDRNKHLNTSPSKIEDKSGKEALFSINPNYALIGYGASET